MNTKITALGMLFSTALLGCEGTKPNPAALRPSETQVLCVGQPIPESWIVVGAQRSATCGPGERVNAWVIERYDDKTPGTEMEVYGPSVVPAGWIVLGYRHTGKFLPKDKFVEDCKTIQRLE